MNMLKQRRDKFQEKKDKLLNLSLFILPRSRTIFRNLKENLSKIIGIDGFGLWRVEQSFCPQLSTAKEDVTQNSVIMHELNKELFHEGNDMP